MLLTQWPYRAGFLMYSLDALWRGVKHPRLAVRELNALYHTRGGIRGYNPSGADVVEEDWDNLVILDACRYDTFAELNTVPGTLERRVSRGSATYEFLHGNFADRTMHDTVYVSANPFPEKSGLASNFHDVVNVWKEDGWDDEYGTVLPETVNAYARDAIAEYPQKRLIVHYMQPHHPFLTDDKPFDENHAVPGTGLWRRILTGDADVDVEVVRHLYRENLETVLPHVRELLDRLEGRTVVTSDHGNILGERSFPIPLREWGHPGRHYLAPLVTVPWLVHEAGERREIVAEAGDQQQDIDEEEVKEKLEDLGYMVE